MTLLPRKSPKRTVIALTAIVVILVATLIIQTFVPTGPAAAVSEAAEVASAGSVLGGQAGEDAAPASAMVVALDNRSVADLIPDDRLKGQVAIRVMDGLGQPIAGAIVSSSSQVAQIGATSTSGMVLLSSEELGTGELAVMADRYISTEVRVTPPFPSIVDVHLRDGAEISGVVLDSEGYALSEGMAVLAVSPLYYFDDRALELTLSGSPLIPLVRTDVEGKFTLSGLEPDLKYRIFAAGLGYVSFDESLPIAPGPDAYVELHANPVYGVVLAFRDEFGKVPPLAPLEGRWHGSARPLEHADWLITTKWTATLLGLKPDCVGELGYYDKWFFFTTHGEEGDSISIRYGGLLPGFAPIDTVVEATRAIDCVSRSEIPLYQICDGFGDVAVAVGPPEFIDSFARSLGKGRECRLVLKDLSSGVVLEARLTSLAPTGYELVSGIPFGEYAASFVGPHQLFNFPEDTNRPVHIRIGPEEALVYVRLPGTGTLELEVTTTDGLPYTGPLLGSHLRQKNNSFDVFYFSSAPYRIPLLPEGDYKVVIDNLLSGDASSHAQIATVSAENESTVLNWKMSR